MSPLTCIQRLFKHFCLSSALLSSSGPSVYKTLSCFCPWEPCFSQSLGICHIFFLFFWQDLNSLARDQTRAPFSESMESQPLATREVPCLDFWRTDHQLWDDGFPKWLSGNKSASQCWSPRRCRLNPWIRKIPWRRKWQPALVFLPGESHGRRSLVGYNL